MAGRAHAYVVRRRNRLAVAPPPACDTTMRRDGVEPKPPRGPGERAWWLEQVVMRTPLASWRELGTPTELATIAANDNWAVTLRRAWARAAVAARDPAWSAALVGAGFGRGTDAELNDTMLTVSLCELLAPDVAEAYALRVLAGPDPSSADVVRLLVACERPWSPRLTTALLEALRDQARRPASPYVGGRLVDLRDAIAAGLGHDTLDQVRAVAATVPADSHLADLFATLTDIVTARHETYQEFA
jgi:hypothetical protein